MEKQNKRVPKLIYKQAELNGVRQDISWRIYVNFPSGCILLLYQATRWILIAGLKVISQLTGRLTSTVW